jgi:hypothetical protein
MSVKCSKHCHKSKGAAEAQKRALLKRADNVLNPETLCTYHCHKCDAWHVGHNEMAIRPEPMPRIPLTRRGPGGARGFIR